MKVMNANLCRRNVLKASGVATVALAASSCGLFAVEPSDKAKDGGTSADGGHDQTAKEAPALRKQVEAGTLPPLEKRLPEHPCVMRPLTSQGHYGGTIRHSQPDATRRDPLNAFTPASLLQWRPGKIEAMPDLAESWRVDDGQRRFTFKLRRGLKWSDGEPFTVADLTFALEQVFGNKTLYPVYPGWLHPQSVKPKIETPDDVTLVLSWPDPNPLLPEFICQAAWGRRWITPKHYLKDFHPDFVDSEELEQKAKDNGFDTWDQYFVNRNDEGYNPDRPVMGPYKITKELTLQGSTAHFDRNPYFYQVDNAGRQLPYVDGIDFEVLNFESIRLRAANGDYDLQGYYLDYDLAPVLLRSAKDNGYSVHRWASDQTLICIYLNHSCKDKVLRDLFHDIDFRAALSHAINRDEINKVMTGGLGLVRQAVCGKEDEYYLPGFGKRFLEYDVDKANALLDGLGLDKRGGDGMRLRPDGQPLHLTLETWRENYGLDRVSAYELVKGYWAKVGIDMTVRTMSNSLWLERQRANQAELAGNMITEVLWYLEPGWYTPTSDTSYMAPAYGLWNESGGTKGMEPIPPFKEMMKNLDRLLAASSDEERLAAGHGIMKSYDENVWVLGILKPPFQPVVVADGLANVLKEARMAWDTGGVGFSKVAQMYFQADGSAAG